MALMGTLADLGVVDLLQFPHAGRKTGELVLAGEVGEARLYYAGGKLVHAALDNRNGMDALVEIVGWTQGEFEFRPGVAAPVATIELDLHRAVMVALKTRDERKAEEERRRVEEERRKLEEEQRRRAEEARRKAEEEAASRLRRELDGQLGRRLAAFVAGAPWALYACALGEQGRVLAEAAGKDGPPAGVERLRAVLQALRESYPRDGLRRVLFEDALGTVIVARVLDDRAVAVVTDKETPVGAASVAVGKLVASLAGGTAGG